MEIFLIKAGQLILCFAILVTLHELGHFLFAKLFGIRVHRFCLFFDVAIGGKRRAISLGHWGGTEFAIGWLPLGGYVEIAGMVDESTNADEVAKEEDKYPAHELFKNKPAWQRLLVMVGGVLVNFLLGLFIYSMVIWSQGEQLLPSRNVIHGYTFSPTAQQMGFRNGDIIIGADGKEYPYVDQTQLLRDLGKAHSIRVLRRVEGKSAQEIDIQLPSDLDLLDLLKQQPPFVAITLPNIVGGLIENGPAAKAGVKTDDRILAVNGQKVTSWNDIDAIMAVIKDQIDAADGEVDPKILQTQLVVQHKGSPRLDSLSFAVSKEAKMGVMKYNVLADYKLETRQHTLLSSIPAGISHGWKVLSGYVSDLRYIFSAEGAKSVGSFGTIGSLFPASWDWVAFWQLTAFISLMLAFMNFLPIPMLDGGYIFITLCEMITRRRLADKWLDRVNTIGFYFIIGLMGLGIFNDLVRFVF